MNTLKTHFNDFVTKISQIYEIEEAKNIAFLVFEHFLKISKIDILVNKTIDINFDFVPIIFRLINHEPIQYIIGEADFYGLKFKVNETTLIPRNETEELVELAIKKLRGAKNQDRKLKVLDIGTGSGCIAISIAKNLDFVEATAWDISEKALETAIKNAQENKVAVQFEKQDILSFQSINTQIFDLIVSNPPYVTVSEKEGIRKNVKDFEPHLALFVEDTDPLVFYSSISKFALKNLTKNGALIVEINEQFGNETKDCFLKDGFTFSEIVKDIHGKDRIVIANV